MTPTSLNNELWFASFREGDHLAFKEVFTQYNRQLCYTAISYLKNPEEAEDIVADVFHKVWEGRHEYNDAGHVIKFLFTAVRNACLNHLKKTSRRAELNKVVAELTPLEEDDVIRKMIEAEMLKRIYEAMEHLPPKCKAVFKKIYVDGATTEEAAIALGITPRNVLNQKQYALQILKGKLIGLALITYLLYINYFSNK